MPKTHSFFPHVALFVIIFVIYSNTFNVPWLFDDTINISENPPLRIDNLMPETLWQTFFATSGNPGKLYRPVACFSFALNWYVGQENTVGYHMVNMGIHYLTALVLYFCIVRLFRTPRLKNTQSGAGVYFIALLSATLWAVNPIQTQAVTYIVQRMASLSGMFYIFAIFSYVSARLEPSSLRYRWFCLCGLSFLLAVGTKENAVLLPFGLLLVEYIFFEKEKDESSRFFFRILITLSLLVVAAGIFYCYRKDLLANFFTQTGHSPISPFERLLTQFRIIFYYLSQIFYPAPSRLSIEHDIAVSVSVISPWTTLISVLGVVSLIFFSFRFVRRFPLLSFAVLFYLVSHLVESTILPLELIFEHRNYIPSFFLMLPVSAGLYRLMSYYSSKNKTICFGLITLTPFIVFSLGIGTYTRNQVYAFPETFWRDALSKAPNHARPWFFFATSAKLGNTDQLKEALALNYKALHAYHPKKAFKPEILMNMGTLFHNYGLYDQAIEYYEKALAEPPLFRNIYHHLAFTYMKKGELNKALEQINIAIEIGEQALTQPHTTGRALLRHFLSNCYDLQGRLFILMGDPEAALISFRKQMTLLEDKISAFYHIGVALSQMEYYEQADWFLKNARNQKKDNIYISFSILENAIRAGKLDEAQDGAWYLLSRFDLQAISDAMEHVQTQTGKVSVDIALIRPMIQTMAERMIAGLSDINEMGAVESEQVNDR